MQDIINQLRVSLSAMQAELETADEKRQQLQEGIVRTMGGISLLQNLTEGGFELYETKKHRLVPIDGEDV